MRTNRTLRRTFGAGSARTRARIRATTKKKEDPAPEQPYDVRSLQYAMRLNWDWTDLRESEEDNVSFFLDDGEECAHKGCRALLSGESLIVMRSCKDNCRLCALHGFKEALTQMNQPRQCPLCESEYTRVACRASQWRRPERAKRTRRELSASETPDDVMETSEWLSKRPSDTTGGVMRMYDTLRAAVDVEDQTACWAPNFLWVATATSEDLSAGRRPTEAIVPDAPPGVPLTNIGPHHERATDLGTARFFSALGSSLRPFIVKEASRRTRPPATSIEDVYQHALHNTDPIYKLLYSLGTGDSEGPHSGTQRRVSRRGPRFANHRDPPSPPPPPPFSPSPRHPPDPHQHVVGAQTATSVVLKSRLSISNRARSSHIHVQYMYMYRGNPPIRNSQFPIWAKGKGVLGPSKTAILKKYT